MTPKEKANELVDRYYWVFGDGYLGDLHKQCALIAVDEILNASTIKLSPNNNGKFIYMDDYWQEVKTEIQNL